MSLDVDDRDPNIAYLPADAWERAIGTPQEHQQTTTFTTTKGRTAEINFYGESPKHTFGCPLTPILRLGNVIQVFGTIPAQSNSGRAPISTYIVDNEPLTFHNYTGRRHESRVQFNQTFYQQGNLGNGPHKLVITSEQDETFLFIDRFHITGDQVSIISLADSTGFSTTPPPGSPNTQDASASTQNGEGQTGKGGPPIGAIVGGAVGGVAVVALIILGVFFLRRRKRTQRTGLVKPIIISEAEMEEQSSTTPFLASPGVVRYTPAAPEPSSMAGASIYAPSNQGLSPHHHGVYPQMDTAQSATTMGAQYRGYNGEGSQVHLAYNPTSSGASSITTTSSPAHAKAREAQRMRVVDAGDSHTADPPPMYQLEPGASAHAQASSSSSAIQLAAPTPVGIERETEDPHGSFVGAGSSR